MCGLGQGVNFACWGTWYRVVGEGAWAREVYFRDAEQLFEI